MAGNLTLNVTIALLLIWEESCRIVVVVLGSECKNLIYCLSLFFLEQRIGEGKSPVWFSMRSYHLQLSAKKKIIITFQASSRSLSEAKSKLLL